MICTIENEFLVVSADTRGSELTSIKNKKNNIEYLWQGKPEIWPGRAYLLFPIIGRLKNESYTYAGKKFSIKIHGFARHSELRAQKNSPTSMSFFLEDSPATFELWPFKFQLEVRYTLTGNALKKEHILHNSDSKEMLYELGGHDGYNVALLPGEKMSDYYLEFENSITELKPYLSDQNIMLTKERGSVQLTQGKLQLNMSLFARDAIIIDTPPAGRITIANTKNEEKIRISFPDFKFVGIWSKPITTDTNYVCIEPWSALPDCSFLDEALENKIGIRKLAPGATETLSFTTEFGEL